MCSVVGVVGVARTKAYHDGLGGEVGEDSGGVMGLSFGVIIPTLENGCSMHLSYYLGHTS